MFNFLKKPVNKIVPVSSGEPVVIDISESRISINQNKVLLPCNINLLTEILGQPRAQKYETKPEEIETLKKMHPKAAIIDRINYMWDDLGIKCYTLDGTTVNTFGIELNKGVLEYPNVPVSFFGGTITIKGQPWLSAIKSGNDEIVLQELRLGSFNLAAEYVDIDQEPNQRTERDYTGLEVSLLQY